MASVPQAVPLPGRRTEHGARRESSPFSSWFTIRYWTPESGPGQLVSTAVQTDSAPNDESIALCDICAGERDI